ncbi:hypothetical protein AX14_007437 [Amanita brunnescens Koide BX004]|nr:hypothetical protein AX14_007437 [Amanita brunnescens Koide BX004]
MDRTGSTRPQKRPAESSHSSVPTENPRKNKQRRIAEPSPEPEEAEEMPEEVLDLGGWEDHPLIVLMRRLHETGWPQFPKLLDGPEDWPGDTMNGLGPDCVIAPDPW